VSAPTTGPRTSVLAALTKSVMEEKTKASGRRLTPVAGEVAPAVMTQVLPKTKAPFPDDMPQEVVEQKAAELTRIIEHLTDARDAMLALVEKPKPEEVVDLDAIRKQKEAALDAEHAAAQAARDEAILEAVDSVYDPEPDFAADFAAKQAAAQAAVFSEPSGASVALEEDMTADENGRITTPDPEWTCPDHGKAIEKVSPATNKTFIGCPDCSKFKR
jgi:hypothetical protein